MVSALNSRSSNPGSSPGWGHCVVFFSKTILQHLIMFQVARVTLPLQEHNNPELLPGVHCNKHNATGPSLLNKSLPKHSQCTSKPSKNNSYLLSFLCQTSGGLDNSLHLCLQWSQCTLGLSRVKFLLLVWTHFSWGQLGEFNKKLIQFSFGDQVLCSSDLNT